MMSLLKRACPLFLSLAAMGCQSGSEASSKPARNRPGAVSGATASAASYRPGAIGPSLSICSEKLAWVSASFMLSRSMQGRPIPALACTSPPMVMMSRIGNRSKPTSIGEPASSP